MSALPSKPPARAPRRPPGRPRLRVVAEPRHHGRWLFLLAAIGAAGVFGVVSLNALAAESAFAARTLEREVDALALQYEELTAEVAALEAPDRVRRVAQGDLGMVEPDLPGFLVAQRTLPEDAGWAQAGTASVGQLTDPLKPMLGAGG
jgi:cell division protein FtsB